MTANSTDSRGFPSSRLGLLYIAAVVVGLLALAGGLFFFVGNGGYTWGRPGVNVLEVRLIAPDRLDLTVNSCNRNPEVSLLRETDVDVEVNVVADPPPSLSVVQECDDHVEVQLQGPLEDRDVIDKRTGKVVRNASSYTEVSVDEASLEPQNRLFLHVSTCDEFPDVSHLVETDVDVQVMVVADAPPFVYGKDCRDRVAIQLQEPLGNRELVDKHTGEVVRVRSR